MTDIALCPDGSGLERPAPCEHAPRYRVRPVDFIRRLVVLGLPACVVALAVALPQFDAEKECRDGAFSAGFSKGFDVRRCDLVIRKTGHEIARVPFD